MKNGLDNFKYEEYGHYELREVCVYIIPYVISSYNLKFKLLNNISHTISGTNEDQCETSQWGRCHTILIWAFCLVTSVSHHFVRPLWQAWQVWQTVTFLIFQMQFGAFSGFWFTGVSAQLKTLVIEYLLNSLRYYQKKKRHFSDI